MSIDNPVGGQPQDPYERYRIARETQEKQGGDRKPPDKKPHLAAKILEMIKKMVESLLNLAGHGKQPEISLSRIFFLFKSDMETLKREDRHQDTLFLNELSDTWHRILEYSVQCHRIDPIYQPLHDFLAEIQSYPPGEEHSFGYYLTEYTGQHWFPFPYMDLILKLHEDHQNHPKDSALSRWTGHLDFLLQLVQDTRVS